MPLPRCLPRVAAVVLTVVALALPAASATYEIDGSHSGVVFKVDHLGFSNFYGRFNDVSGTFDFDPGTGNGSAFRVKVDAGSVDSASDRRDTHLRSPDFLNAKQFPTIELISTDVRKKGEKHFEADAELTLRGVKKPVVVDIRHIGHGEHARFGVRAGFEATFKVRRADFGVNYMPEGLGAEVELIVFIEGVHK